MTKGSRQKKTADFEDIVLNTKGVPNLICLNVICYVNMENHFLTFTKHIAFTRIMLGTPFLRFVTNKVARPLILQSEALSCKKFL